MNANEEQQESPVVAVDIEAEAMAFWSLESDTLWDAAYDAAYAAVVPEDAEDGEEYIERVREVTFEILARSPFCPPADAS